MNIELEEVVVQDVSDDALEQAAGGAQGNGQSYCGAGMYTSCPTLFYQGGQMC